MFLALLFCFRFPPTLQANEGIDDLTPEGRLPQGVRVLAVLLSGIASLRQAKIKVGPSELRQKAFSGKMNTPPHGRGHLIQCSMKSKP